MSRWYSTVLVRVVEPYTRVYVKDNIVEAETTISFVTTIRNGALLREAAERVLSSGMYIVPRDTRVEVVEGETATLVVKARVARTARTRVVVRGRIVRYVERDTETGEERPLYSHAETEGVTKDTADIDAAKEELERELAKYRRELVGLGRAIVVEAAATGIIRALRARGYEVSVQKVGGSYEIEFEDGVIRVAGDDITMDMNAGDEEECRRKATYTSWITGDSVILRPRKSLRDLSPMRQGSPVVAAEARTKVKVREGEEG